MLLKARRGDYSAEEWSVISAGLRSIGEPEDDGVAELLTSQGWVCDLASRGRDSKRHVKRRSQKVLLIVFVDPCPICRIRSLKVLTTLPQSGIGEALHPVYPLDRHDSRLRVHAGSRRPHKGVCTPLVQ